MADISSTLAAWSSTTASNPPAGATTIGTGLDDNLREIQGVIVRGLSHKGADIASVAGTTDIGAVEGLMHDITGTETITGLGTVRAGIWKILKFEGLATLTHNGTSLILPSAANIKTGVGDVGIFMSEGSGNWRCLHYQGSGSHATSFTWNGSGGSTGTINISWQRVGNWVTLNLPVISATTGTGSTILSADTVLPTNLRPSAATQVCPLNNIANNAAGIASAGLMAIGTVGTLSLVKDNTNAAFTNGAAAGTTTATSLTYYVG